MHVLTRPVLGRARWILGLIAVLMLVAVACGGSAPADTSSTASTASTAPQPTLTVAIPNPTATNPPPAGGGGSASTPAPVAAAAEVSRHATPATSTKDSITVVTSGEPVNLDIHSNECSGNIDHMMCQELAGEPFTWIDGTTFEVVPLSLINSWEQIDPERWRFYLRAGNTFHNGEPWNAESAKFGLDLNGDGTHGGGFSMHSFIRAEVVDDLTVDVVCLNSDGDTTPCPIFPRTGLFAKFAAPNWWANASDEERAREPVSNGPYVVTGWQSGVDVTAEAFEDYQANPGIFDAQNAIIKNVRQVWRAEAFVRAAMVNSGEADWADNIGFENAELVPQAIQSGTNEIYTLVADNMWHPELKKKKVRMALAHAINCQEIVENLYDNRNECFGNISQPGTLGINEANSAPYAFDQELSRQLLAEAGYDPENEIRIHTRSGRVYRDVELHEAVVGYWNEVGVNAKVQVLENAQATNHRRSGCGKFETAEIQRMCADQPPPPPVSASTHYYETATSNESLDYARQLTLRLSCHNVNSRVCYADLEAKAEIAKATPLGEERRILMEELAQTAHDEYWFIPFFHVQAVYGLAEDLAWTPRYDPRIRVSTMRFQ